VTVKQSFYDSLTDEELLALRSRDKSADRVFYRRYRPRVKRWAEEFHVRDRDDLIQEGMIALYEAARTYSPERHARFNTYARTCVYNHLISYVRGLKKGVDVVDPDEMNEIPETTQSLEEKTADRLVVEGFMSTLSPLEKKILVKRFMERKSYLDIAAELAISAKKVDNILYKIRQQLEHYLRN